MRDSWKPLRYLTHFFTCRQSAYASFAPWRKSSSSSPSSCTTCLQDLLDMTPQTKDLLRAIAVLFWSARVAWLQKKKKTSFVIYKPALVYAEIQLYVNPSNSDPTLHHIRFFPYSAIQPSRLLCAAVPLSEPLNLQVLWCATSNRPRLS